jgi:hypothetical protein
MVGYWIPGYLAAAGRGGGGGGGGGGGDDSEDDMAVVLLGARFFPTSSPRVIVAKYYVRWPNKNLCNQPK